MFYTVKRSETLIIPPQDINPDIRANITQQLKAKVEGQVTQEYGLTIAITKIDDIRSNGRIDVNDGSVHFNINFECFIIAPQPKEVLPGSVTGLTGNDLLIVSCGPMQCLVHPDQIMNGSYHFDTDSREFVHIQGTEPSITHGTEVWIQVLSETFNIDNTIIGSVVKVVR